MSVVQQGYLGGTGPVFISNEIGIPGKVMIIQGVFEGGKLVYKAKDPSYASQLRALGDFKFESNQCALQASVLSEQNLDLIIGSYLRPFDWLTNYTYMDVTKGVTIGQGWDITTPSTGQNPTSTNPVTTTPTGNNQTTPAQTYQTTAPGSTVIYNTPNPAISQQTIAIGIGAIALLFLLINRD